MKTYKRILTAVLSILIIFSCILNVSALQDNEIYLSAPDFVSLNQTFEVTVSISGKNIYGVNSSIFFDTSLVKFDSIKCFFPSSWKTETNVVDDQIIFASTDEMLKSPISKKIDVVKIKFTALALSTECVFESKDTFFTDLVDNISVADNLTTIEINEPVNDNEHNNSLQEEQQNNPQEDITQSSPQEDQQNELPEVEENIPQWDFEEDLTIEDEQVDNNEEILEMFESNYLKSLVVKNAEISPSFDPEIKDYTATVPYQIKELQVEAVPLDENATVTISETELKYIGRNITRIQVISTSGKKRTYKIYTTRNKNTNVADIDNGNGFLWLWILIGSVLVLGIATTVVILWVKKRKVKKQ